MGFPDADYSGRYRLSDGLDVPLFRPSRQRADGCSARSLRSGKSPAVRAPRSVGRIGTQRKDLKRRTSLGAAILWSSVGFMAHHVLIVAGFFRWSSPLTYALP